MVLVFFLSCLFGYFSSTFVCLWMIGILSFLQENIQKQDDNMAFPKREWKGTPSSIVSYTQSATEQDILESHSQQYVQYIYIYIFLSFFSCSKNESYRSLPFVRFFCFFGTCCCNMVSFLIFFFYDQKNVLFIQPHTNLSTSSLVLLPSFHKLIVYRLDKEP